MTAVSPALSASGLPPAAATTALYLPATATGGLNVATARGRSLNVAARVTAQGATNFSGDAAPKGLRRQHTPLDDGRVHRPGLPHRRRRRRIRIRAPARASLRRRPLALPLLPLLPLLLPLLPLLLPLLPRDPDRRGGRADRRPLLRRRAAAAGGRRPRLDAQDRGADRRPLRR